MCKNMWNKKKLLNSKRQKGWNICSGLFVDTSVMLQMLSVNSSSSILQLWSLDLGFKWYSWYSRWCWSLQQLCGFKQHVYCLMLEKPRAVPHFNPHPGHNNRASESLRGKMYSINLALWTHSSKHANAAARSRRDLRGQNERREGGKCTVRNKSHFAEVITASFTGTSGMNGHKFTGKAASACWENAVVLLHNRRWDLHRERGRAFGPLMVNQANHYLVYKVEFKYQ